MSLDQLEGLAYLVRLDLPTDLPEVHQLGDVRVDVDMTASPDSAQPKSEARLRLTKSENATFREPFRMRSSSRRRFMTESPGLLR